MDTNLDLNTASREVLRAVIVQQQAVIAQLQRRIEVLEGKAKPGGPRGMPGIKPSAGQRPPRKDGPRKPRPHGFARQRMTPTHRVVHRVESCPECGTRPAGGWVQRTREVIDVPVVPVQITEHVFIARTCPVCERRRMPQADLAGVVLGKQRLGINLLSLIAALREEGRLPLRTIRCHPVVPEDGASLVPEPGRHRPGHPSGGPEGPTGTGKDCGPYPGQPSGTRR